MMVEVAIGPIENAKSFILAAERKGSVNSVCVAGDVSGPQTIWSTSSLKGAQPRYSRRFPVAKRGPLWQ
ncbi:hypothetical protein CALCODRAFT_505062 [Calocera cornea HHB12733]|uniref:Uncharacterized protein n=1 Tax=Calocera cornea HHB12733 TaxID=1353952 RepID=A0A165C1A6_9BASI|nr:hypothetical protein CALCODRAFT_505062 [Calocera cornea HHB12733]